MKTLLKKLIKDSRGGTAIEYGLIASLIVIAAMSAIQGVADETSSMWKEVKDKSADAVKGP